MRRLRDTFIAVGLLAIASPAAASLERVRGLQCTGSTFGVTILFNHDDETAEVAAATGTRTLYRYEADDAFLTWRLIDAEGRRAYVLREGDKINGDLGWYLTALPATNGTGEPQTGTCAPVD